MHQPTHNKVSRRRKEREGIENVFEETTAEKFSLKEGNRYPGTGRTEGPKQDDPKQTHTKIYHN